MKTKGISRVVALLLLFTLLLSVSPLTEVAWAAETETGAAEPVPQETEVSETQTSEPVLQETAASEAEDPEALPPAEESTSEEQEPQESETPEFTEETDVRSETEPEEPTPTEAPEEDLTWMDAGLLLLVNGTLVPYNPATGEADPSAVGGGKRAVPSGIYYSDTLGAHGSDLNGTYIKSGGQYDSWVYGNNQWWPYSTGVLSPYTNKRVRTDMLYCNDGPSHYKTESGVLAIPIRPSQESGWSTDVNGYGSYTTRSTGVPTYKSESLYTKLVPNYSAAAWTQINLIYGVARGMGGMTESGNTNITAAASTLISNVVFGYIGLGSDKAFHGKPVMTSSNAVNTQMLEIMVRCEVYSKEKGLTGSASGDNTVAAIKAKGYTATNTSGWYVKSGTAASTAMGYFQINRSQSNGNQIYIYATNEITFDSGNTISLKKTTLNASSVAACIQNNPLYTLQGAVYEIHQGSANGTVVETLTTNANGEAAGTKKYPLGTKLYAVEKTAPSGYLLNTTPVELTVSSGSNVFNVTDTPTFDPNSLVITKTGDDSVRIAGAVFKVEFFASNWADASKLLKTWYFQSNAAGTVRLTESFLASGYSSDSMFKVNGNVVMPLGCVVVTEVKAANGYLLPQGNNASVCMFIRQGGTKTAQMGKPAGAYWGDASANPINTTNPKGIYKMENDADPKTLTAVNTEVFGKPFSIQKVDPSNVPLAGAVFKVEYFDAGWFDSTKLERTWYFKTDSNGYFTLQSKYLADGYTSDTLFPTNKIPLGIMRVQEVKAPDGFQLVSFTGIWRMKQHESGSSVVDSYWAASDGNTPTTSYGSVAYVLDADPAKLYVSNAPIPGTMELQKIAENGDVKDYCFKLYQWSANKSWYGKTDSNGKLYVTDDTYSASGTKVYTFEGLTDGTYTLLEVLSLHGKDNVWPESIRITVNNNGAAKYDRTFTEADFSKDENGDCRLNKVAITGLSGGGVMSITVKNKPTTVPVEIIKTSADGVVKDISFKVERYETESGAGWTEMGTFKTNASGKIQIDLMPIGTRLRITEIVPADYICLSQNPQTITLAASGNQVSFENKPVSRLELIKQSEDGNVKDISFLIEEYEPEGGIGWWSRGTYQTDDSGKISLELKYGYRYRITENVPADYVCANRVQEFTAKTGTNTVTFVNHPIVKLDLIKTADDGHVANIDFKFEKYDAASKKWVLMDTYRTDADGKIHLEELSVGMRLRITEIIPEGYQTEAAVKEITLVRGTNTVTFVNERINEFEIIKTADNGKVDDIEFTVFDVEGRSIVSGRTDQNGKLILRSEELQVGVYYMIMETVPEGYLCEENAQTIQLQFGTNTVHFENRRIFGDLELIKVDESYPDTRLTGAEFTVTLTRPDGSSETVPMPELLDDEGKGTGVYRLEHIEYGTVCVVQETKAPEGFLLSDKTFTVTIEEEKTYQIGDPGFECVTNREKSGTIQVKKVDTQGRAMPGVSFLLEFSLDGRSWAPVTYRETDSAVTAGGCANEQLSNGILVTDRNGLAVYPGLALTLGDRVLHYRLTEVSTQNGKQLLPEPAFEGTLPYNGAEDITVTAVNAQGFVIPKTGGRGFVMTSLGVFAAGSAALTLLLVLKKRRGLGV